MTKEMENNHEIRFNVLAKHHHSTKGTQAYEVQICPQLATPKILDITVSKVNLFQL